MEEPLKADYKRNTDGTFGAGNHANDKGRPPGKTLKEYKAEKFRTMSDEEKEAWIKENKIGGETQWRMAEGNPATDEKHEVTGRITIKWDE